MPKAEETVLEIDLKALKHNFEFIKSKVEGHTKLLAVVKAFAYGSDLGAIALYLETLKVDYFAVAYASEGAAIRDAGVKTPILVLHPQTANFKLIIEKCLEPSLYTAKILSEFIDVAHQENQKDYPVHIKLNTGLNRLGFENTDINFVMSKTSATAAIKIKSIFSHLAASEDANEKEFTEKQIRLFKAMTEKCAKAMGYKPWLHLANTSGILNYKEAHLDMVRSGIGLYGYGNSEEENKHLKPVATLKSVISQIRTIGKGETVGYNRAYKSKRITQIATIPIGHADGISRQYGHNKGSVMVNGKKTPIVGNVCMDMIMIDVTTIKCQEGDEVILFGNHQNAAQFANAINTISYEVLTSISQRVKRVIINDA